MENTDHLLNLYTEISVAVTNAIEGIREDIRKELLAENKESSTHPKYDVGDLVYFEYKGIVCSRPIASVNAYQTLNGIGYHYTINELGSYYEQDLYPTKSQLAQARLEYWKKILIEC